MTMTWTLILVIGSLTGVQSATIHRGLGEMECKALVQSVAQLPIGAACVSGDGKVWKHNK